MKTIRRYGKSPFTVAVVHGGPGALGEMAPVAIELSNIWGTLESIHASTSIEGQIQELKLIKNFAALPITLIGHSWGAWLSFIFTARYPEFVKKLILVGSAPFEEQYATHIMKTRLNRLNREESIRVDTLRKALLDSNTQEIKRNETLLELGRLMSKADSFEPLSCIKEDIQVQLNTFQSVWEEAIELRRSGKLLDQGKHINCPVIAIHGDYDPHPFEGVKQPLSQMIDDFRFILLKDCGHKPWIERHARDEFYDILRDELRL
jgi:pimeloyl-ACP methyl ester carboxylesterase